MVTGAQLEARYHDLISHAACDKVMCGSEFFKRWYTMRELRAITDLPGKTKAFVKVATDLSKPDDKPGKPPLQHLLQHLATMPLHATHVAFLQRIAADDPARLPLVQTAVDWPTFKVPNASRRVRSAGKGDSYEENVDDLLGKAIALRACLRACGPDVGKSALICRYGPHRLRNFVHALRDYDGEMWGHKKWQYLADERICEIIATTFANDEETEPGHWTVSALITAEDREEMAKRCAQAYKDMIQELGEDSGKRRKTVHRDRYGYLRIISYNAAKRILKITGRIPDHLREEFKRQAARIYRIVAPMALRKELSCPFCDGGLTWELEAAKAAKKDKTANDISFSHATIDALHPRCRGGQYVKENVVLCYNGGNYIKAGFPADNARLLLSRLALAKPALHPSKHLLQIPPRPPTCSATSWTPLDESNFESWAKKTASTKISV
ncbi:hypothetical protein BDZ90DRAFT_177946 [Jaminaea rosea]|uniref:Uncharacterized protein n=1 Tax=Jaminaea rosea TaxID=1569628 RepID=A0A316UWD0_9BASI|nr:hypothetical protein BDZ90DRAFT_177946 [Jaminaea rosea]PWN27425.1 hypothetical protein BDZ90DRAFT_177946 [Jaminaea rosea]